MTDLLLSPSLSSSSRLIVCFLYSTSRLTHILQMPGKRVAMVTVPRWTPFGHFSMTEKKMSPICVCECGDRMAPRVAALLSPHYTKKILLQQFCFAVFLPLHSEYKQEKCDILSHTSSSCSKVALDSATNHFNRELCTKPDQLVM